MAMEYLAMGKMAMEKNGHVQKLPWEYLAMGNCKEFNLKVGVNESGASNWY